MASAAAAHVGAALHGADLEIRTACAFPNSLGHSLSFLERMPGVAPASASAAACVLAKADALPMLLDASYSVIVSATPKYDLARIHADLLTPPFAQGAVHASAVIGAGVVVHPTASIGPGCVLEGEIRIGPRCRLGANVVLVNAVALESDVRVRNGTVIGEDAFSFGFSPEGASVRFPSLAGVQIGPRVEIGNNAVISRGIFEDTVIEADARINDLAHVGNSVHIGPFSLIMAQTDISARVRVGSRCWIGQSAAIRQGVRIGDGAQVGMGAVVTRDVAPGVVAFGVPARTVRARS